MSVVSCLACYYLTEERFIMSALASAIVVTMTMLLPVALIAGAWSRYLRLRVHGTIHATGEQRLALLRRHAVFRVLSNATTALILLAGGLLVQLGYMTLVTEPY